MRKVLILSISVLFVGLAAQSMAADTPKSLVEYRQAVMKAIGAHTGAIAMVVKGEVSNGPQVVYHARSLADMSVIVPEIFPPNSRHEDYSKTDALPEIWAEPEKFKEAVEAFQVAAANLADVSNGGDSDAIAAAFGEMGRSCGGCHKPFRYKE